MKKKARVKSDKTAAVDLSDNPGTVRQSAGRKSDIKPDPVECPTFPDRITLRLNEHEKKYLKEAFQIWWKNHHSRKWRKPSSIDVTHFLKRDTTWKPESEKG